MHLTAEAGTERYASPSNPLQLHWGMRVKPVEEDWTLIQRGGRRETEGESDIVCC